MELRDLIVTPFVILVVYAVAYRLRRRVCDAVNLRYFLPALTLKIFGALAIGFIYQFYYDGGDTFNYHIHGSRVIWNAFTESPVTGIKLLLSDGSSYTGLYDYANQIYFFRDRQSFAVIRVAALFDLLTFSSYSATAVLFSVVGFIGSWMLFLTFYRKFQRLHVGLAVATLFVPSVIFWGSGLLKDTLTFACVCLATYAVDKMFIRRQVTFTSLLLLVVALEGLYLIKLYILLTLLPTLIIWVFMTYLGSIRSPMLRVIAFPGVMILSVVLGYFAMLKASEDNPKYSLSALSKTAQITAYDIRYYTGKDAGSGYSLGKLDGTWDSMLSLAPQAINVALFRPYLWEVHNPLMLLSALESLALLVFTVSVVFTARHKLPAALLDPTVIFCLLFSVTFAFAVGVSTYNFGTLVRYKIPLLPFFLIALMVVRGFGDNKPEAEANQTA